jgi:hypothetical protein
LMSPVVGPVERSSSAISTSRERTCADCTTPQGRRGRAIRPLRCASRPASSGRTSKQPRVLGSCLERCRSLRADRQPACAG